MTIRDLGDEPEGLELLRDRLGFDVLAFDGNPNPAMVRKLSVQLPAKAQSTAARWTSLVPDITEHVRLLQDERVTGRTRRGLFVDLRDRLGIEAERFDDVTALPRRGLTTSPVRRARVSWASPVGRGLWRTHSSRLRHPPQPP